MLTSMTHSLLRQLFYALPTLSFMGIVAIIAAHQINEYIFSPPRRSIHSYHLEHLQNPAQFGLEIRTHQCLDGKVPCLLVEPSRINNPGRRGTVLRKQLADKGITLPAYGTSRGMMVLLHGRNGRKEDLLAVAERFAAAGFRCLIPDLPGHGDSPLPTMAFGSSEFERNLPAEILSDARQHFQLPDEPAVLWGMSMGGAFAVGAARSAPAWDALMVVSSFAALDEVLKIYIPNRWHKLANIMQPFFDAAQWLNGEPGISQMQPAQWAKQLSVPALVVHGERDRYVPIQQGRKLYESLASKEKHWITVPGGGHRSVLATSMPLYAEMSAWLLQTLEKQQLVTRAATTARQN
ncbi:MAG: alpha/beta fold hydrolase [Thiolinea sp.]